MLRSYIETIRLEDGIPQGLEWHQRRVDMTLKDCLGQANGFRLSELMPSEAPAGRSKWRLVYGAEGITDMSVSPYSSRCATSLRLAQADTLDYRYKALDRTALDRLYSERGESSDVLIVQGGLLTDTTIYSIALGDGVRWLMPETPLLHGTTRWALEAEGRAECARLTVEDLGRYPYIALFNALNPLGEIILPTDRVQFPQG